MEFLILIAVVAGLAWFGFSRKKTQGTTNQTRSSTKSREQNTSSSNKLSFQASGTAPKKDSAGRVIVKLKGSSSGILLGVNLSKLEQVQAKKLAGRVSEEEDFSKSIKVRMRPDTNSQFKDSVLIETVDEKFIGWILKDVANEAISVMTQVESALVSSVPELKREKFTFEVTAKIEGYWSDESEDKTPDWFADIQEMDVQIKVPAQVEVD